MKVMKGRPELTSWSPEVDRLVGVLGRVELAAERARFTRDGAALAEAKRRRRVLLAELERIKAQALSAELLVVP